MIRHTFSILQGIGEKLEKRLWHQGILTWDDFLRAKNIDHIGVERKQIYDEALYEAQRNLKDLNAAYFSRLLKLKEHWRLFEEFKGYIIALDIETNGFPCYAGGEVTLVGLYDGFDYKALIRGSGLSSESLERELSGYKLLLTFYGSVFDLPFLREKLGITFSGVHFDLCFGFKRVGFKGGLKRIEQLLEIHRDESVKGFDGYDAVRLWEEARGGHDEAWELLLTYNKFDTINLFELADILYDKLKTQTGINQFLNSTRLPSHRNF